MRPIKLPVSFEIKKIPSGKSVNLKNLLKEISKRKDRGIRIISAALVIENEIKDILKNSIFSELKDSRDYVSSLILDSDWCTFSAKIKMLQSVINKYKFLKGESKNILYQLLSKVIKYRNAFTHGTISYDHESNEFILNYFEVQPKTSILDESYWEKLEAVFKDTMDKLNMIKMKLSK